MQALSPVYKKEKTLPSIQRKRALALGADMVLTWHKEMLLIRYQQYKYKLSENQ